jgi:hypothetical protein
MCLFGVAELSDQVITGHHYAENASLYFITLLMGYIRG